jgi:hypothetical protein
LGRSTLAPRKAYSSGLIQACANASAATGTVSQVTASRPTPVSTNGTVSATVQMVQTRA